MSKLSFKSKMLLNIAVGCLLCTTAAIVLSSQRLKQQGYQSLEEKSRAVLSRIEVGARYVAGMDATTHVVNETVQKFPDGIISAEQKEKILKTVPIYAAFQIGESGADKEGYQFRVASTSPRNEKYRATAEEKALIEKFRADPSLTEHAEVSSDGDFVRVSRPVRISQKMGCLTCHGHPSTSPWKNGKDILGYSMEDLKEGDIRGIFTIISNTDEVKAAVDTSFRSQILWGIYVLAIALVIGFYVQRGPMAKIQTTTDQLLSSATLVADMSTKMANTSDRVSSGATEQAAALQETSAAMEEVRSMVEQNTENSIRSTQTAAESEKTAQRAKQAVAEAIGAIEEIDRSNIQISSQIEDGNRQIREIVQVISEIGAKTKVINDIVFQTKLLSFNASVEAARAGEHGKGFAVVAEEIGSLAQMSGSAADEISKMIQEGTEKVQRIVNETQTKVEGLVLVGKEKVNTGTLVTRHCGDVLDEIVLNVQSLSQMVGQISAGSREQSKGVEEISKAILQLEKIAQENSSASKESSDASDQLSEQSADLRASVESLIQTMNGESEEA